MTGYNVATIPVILVYVAIFLIGFSAILAILATITIILQNFAQQSTGILITCIIVYYKIGKLSEDSARKSGCESIGELPYHILTGSFLATVYIGAIFA
jgi:hypothetical protein